MQSNGYIGESPRDRSAPATGREIGVGIPLVLGRDSRREEVSLEGAQGGGGKEVDPEALRWRRRSASSEGAGTGA